MNFFKSYLKFFVKIKLVAPLRSFFLLFSGGEPNKEGWDDRILIVNLEALGDLVVFTSVLKHYKLHFPNKKIYFFIRSDFGIEKMWRGEFADEMLTVDYRKFASSPIYGAHLIGQLRKIGFRRVIEHDFSASEIMGKIISVNLGAEEVVGYEGLGVEFRSPYDIQQRRNVNYSVKKLYPKYTKLIKRIDDSVERLSELPSAIANYGAIYEGVVGFEEGDLSTTMGGLRSWAGVAEKFLRNNWLYGKKYAVFNVGASVGYKRWPLERFAKLAEILKEGGVIPVLAGVPRELALGKELEKLVPGTINFIGKTSLMEFIGLVENAHIVISNDTSTVHVAVALKRPSLCVIGGGQFGMFSNYGYPDINKWAYKEIECFGDNWRCGRGLPTGVPAPCVDAVSAETAAEILRGLLGYLKTAEGYPKEAFRA